MTAHLIPTRIACIGLVALVVIMAGAMRESLATAFGNQSPAGPILTKYDVTAHSECDQYVHGEKFKFKLIFSNPTDYTNFGQGNWKARIAYTKSRSSSDWGHLKHHAINSSSEWSYCVHVNAQTPKASSDDGGDYGGGKGKVIVTSDEYQGDPKGGKGKTVETVQYVVGTYQLSSGAVSYDGLPIDPE